MKLDDPLILLPYRFDAARLAEALPGPDDAAWRSHPDGWDGFRAMALMAPGGEADASARYGPIEPTAALVEREVVARALAALDTVLGRTLAICSDAGARSPRRVDAGYYWHRRARILLPLSGRARVEVGEDSLELEAGRAWLVDGWRGWRIEAASEEPLLFLTLETVGSATFWSRVQAAERPLSGDTGGGMSPRTVRLDPPASTELEAETVRLPRVMHPSELENLAAAGLAEVRAAAPDKAPVLDKLAASLDSFQRQWAAAWARHGEDPAGDAAYRQALEQISAQLAQFRGRWQLANGLDAAELLHRLVIRHALHDEEGRTVAAELPTPPGKRKPAQPAPERAGTGDSSSQQPPDRQQAPAGTAGASAEALRSVHTRSFPSLLERIGASLLVTTYQAGKLVVVRAREGRLNTHFRMYNRPMGLAHHAGRLAMGTATAVEEYRNMADVAAKLEPAGRHDAAFLPRQVRLTGNIDIHEMDFAGDELWLVNTRFSCLCTLDGEHSFVPRWRPGFISGYAPEDRCHLNGLEVVDGKPRYVTALGATDEAGGWRENKAGGGILMDVESGEIICRGLSMPHSPRYYDGKLWVLESGNGTLATVDPATGEVETVVELPGFTRGLDFYGPLAFVGLSQVRESAVFSGIKLTERVSERNCGVWVVDLRSAKIVAFLKFEDAVQEVFAVSVLPGVRHPDVLPGNDPLVGTSYALPDDALREVIRPAPASGE